MELFPYIIKVNIKGGIFSFQTHLNSSAMQKTGPHEAMWGIVCLVCHSEEWTSEG